MESSANTALSTAAPGDAAASDAPDDAAASAPPGDAAASIAPGASRVRLREWLRDHDDQWPFVVVYLGASVVLSIFISLFWLLLVIAIHFAFECYRQSHYIRGGSSVLLHALWEVKLDIGLAALAFAVALYVDMIMGLLGVQSAARIAQATRVGARAAAWERNLRTFLVTIDEITRVSHAAYTLSQRRRGRANGTPAAATSTAARVPNIPAWQARWGWGDRIGVALVSVGVSLILLAPLLSPHDIAGSLSVILQQLRPFPS